MTAFVNAAHPNDGQGVAQTLPEPFDNDQRKGVDRRARKPSGLPCMRVSLHSVASNGGIGCYDAIDVVTRQYFRDTVDLLGGKIGRDLDHQRHTSLMRV